MSGPALGPTQPPPPYNGYPSSFPKRKVNHPPPRCAEVKNEWSYTSAIPCAFTEWTVATLSSLLFPSHQRLGLAMYQLLSRFPTVILKSFLIYLMWVTCPSHPTLLTSIALVLSHAEHRLRSFSIFKFQYPPVYSLSDPNIENINWSKFFKDKYKRCRQKHRLTIWVNYNIL
jgi:hypothetical protein